MRYDSKQKDTIIDALNVHIRNKNLGMVVIDEVHKCKSPDSAQSKGILALDNNICKMAMTRYVIS